MFLYNAFYISSYMYFILQNWESAIFTGQNCHIISINLAFFYMTSVFPSFGKQVFIPTVLETDELLRNHLFFIGRKFRVFFFLFWGKKTWTLVLFGKGGGNLYFIITWTLEFVVWLFQKICAPQNIISLQNAIIKRTGCFCLTTGQKKRVYYL